MKTRLKPRLTFVLICSFFPLSFQRPVQGAVSRFPTCPNLVPVVAASIRVGVRITRRNRHSTVGILGSGACIILANGSYASGLNRTRQRLPFLTGSVVLVNSE